MKREESWSYSRYGMYKQCPKKYKFAVIDGLPQPRLTEGPAFRGVGIHAMFENYLLGKRDDLTSEFDYYTSFLDEMKKQKFMFPEIKLAFTREWEPCKWDAKDRWFRCILDALIVEEGTITIYDWKTGKEYPDHVNQREVYAVAVNAVYPNIENIECYHVYLDGRALTKSVYSKDQIPAIREKWEDKVQMMFDEQWYPANPSWLCRYCHFRKANGGPCEF